MKQRYVIFCMALLAAGIFASAAWSPVSAAPPLGVGHEQEWVQYIRTAGPAEAYADFADAIAEETVPNQHTHAHFFGAALFDAVGVSGLPTCDSRFSFGCFHEFLGHAIRDLGLDVVSELNDGCKKALPHTFLSCQHGIGHGVFAHFGYDDAALFAALDVCATLPDADVIGGCYGGVFMEYNLRTMWGVSAQMRPLEKDMQYPCSIVAEPYATACLYWQPQWWIGIVRAERPTASREERMRIIGRHCIESRDREHCFEGIGNMMLSESRDERGEPSIEAAQRSCAAAAESRADELHCLSVVANHFGIDVSKDAGKQVCAELTGESRAYCEQHADNTANIAQRIPFPDL